jgi:hypothetical protein
MRPANLPSGRRGGSCTGGPWRRWSPAGVKSCRPARPGKSPWTNFCPILTPFSCLTPPGPSPIWSYPRRPAARPRPPLAAIRPKRPRTRGPAWQRSGHPAVPRPKGPELAAASPALKIVPRNVRHAGRLYGLRRGLALSGGGNPAALRLLRRGAAGQRGVRAGPLCLRRLPHPGRPGLSWNTICLTTPETDMIALLQEIRGHPAIPLHGPEHHMLVPGVILAAYRNLGGEVSPEMLRTALRRGRSGARRLVRLHRGLRRRAGCGHRLQPAPGGQSGEGRRTPTGAANHPGGAPGTIGFAAARCCQRDSWLALTKAAELSRDYLPIALRAEAPLYCTQARQNRECLGTACPLWEGVSMAAKAMKVSKGR